MRIKAFFGREPNAVKIPIWRAFAICSLLLIKLYLPPVRNGASPAVVSMACDIPNNQIPERTQNLPFRPSIHTEPNFESAVSLAYSGVLGPAVSLSILPPSTFFPLRNSA